MRDTLKRLLRLSAGYSLVTILGPLFSVLLTPLYTRVLEPADYGIVDVSLTLTYFVTTFTLLGLDQALSVHFFDGDDARRRDLVTTAMAYVAAASVAVGAMLIAAAPILADVLFRDPTRAVTLRIVTVIVLTSPLYSLCAAALRLRMGVRSVNALGLSYLLALVATNVVLVLGLRYKATGVLAASGLANVVGCGVGLWLVLRSLRGRVDRTLLPKLLEAGAGLTVAGIGVLMLSNLDRLLLTQYVSQTDIGLYSIANKLTSMQAVAVSIFWNAWWPMSLEMASRPEAPAQYRRVFELFAAGTMFVGLGIAVFAPEILVVFTRDVYVPAAPFVAGLVAPSAALFSLTSFGLIALYVRKRIATVTALALATAAINLGLNLVLNPVLGVWGAVIATGVAIAAQAVCLAWLGGRAMPVPYRYGRWAVMAGAFLLLLAAPYAVPAFASVPAKAGLMTLFGIAIAAAGVVTSRDVAAAARSVRYRLGRGGAP